MSPITKLGIPLSFAIFLIFSCATNKETRAKLVLQESNLASFSLSEEEVERIFANSGLSIAPTGCQHLREEDLNYLFGSLQVLHPSLFQRKGEPLFPIGEELQSFSKQVLNSIQSLEGKPLFLFFVWKQDDDLAPNTRILRTSFYLFCENKRTSIILGELEKTIAFQNQYSFVEWVSAPRFTIEPSTEERILILKTSKDRISFHKERLGQNAGSFQNWINLYQDPIAPKPNPSINHPETTSPKDSIENRLRTLERLKEDGLITEQEYNKKRSEILDSL